MSKVPLLHGFCQKRKTACHRRMEVATLCLWCDAGNARTQSALTKMKAFILAHILSGHEDRIRTHLRNRNCTTVLTVTTSAHTARRWRTSHAGLYISLTRLAGNKENVDKVEKIIKGLLHKHPDCAFYSPLHATGPLPARINSFQLPLKPYKAFYRHGGYGSPLYTNNPPPVNYLTS